MILADKIVQLRKKNGWSQEQLAEKMDVSRQAVSKWESEQAVPDIDKILQLSSLFGVSVDYLLKDEIEDPSTAEAEEPVSRINAEAVFTRVKMALADGEFSEADRFCEMILNEDPTCAEAYLYKLLAELKLSSREALAEYQDLYDKSNNYKRAFRFGDEALRAELVAPLNATALRLKAEKQEADYLCAQKMLADAKRADVCHTARNIFLALGSYRDAQAQAEICRQTAERLAEERKIKNARLAKLWKKIILGTVGGVAAVAVTVTLLTVSALCIYFFGFRLAVPNGMCEDALALTEEGKYEDALELLADAKEKALFESTKDKIEDAVDHTKKARDEMLKQKAAEEARRAEVAATVEIAEAQLEEGSFYEGVCTMLSKNIPVCVSYEADGATLMSGGEEIASSVLYREEALFDVASAKLDHYSFVKWELAAHGYDGEKEIYSLTLRAVFSANQYKITYTGGGDADNPEGYDTTTPTFTLKAPVREGYTFIGWTGTDLTGKTMTVTIETGSSGGRRYTAHWEANMYRVTLDAADAGLSPHKMSVTFGRNFSLPTPKRAGYTFDGWYRGDDRISTLSPWKIAEDVTLTAKWTPISYDIRYVLGEVAAKNSNPATYTVEMGKITLKNLSYPNCVFLGWYSDATYTNRVTVIDSQEMQSITLYARWIVPTFNVYLDLNGGTGISETVLTYSALDLPLSLDDLVPQMTQYEFYYWAKDEMDGVPVDELTDCTDVTLVANYLPEGTEIAYVHGYGFSGYRCWARYWPSVSDGTTTQTSLVFPKYNRLNSTLGGPYIDWIYIVVTNGVERISYSSEVVAVDIYTGASMEQIVR